MTDKKPTKKSKSTSWGGVAHWYDTLLARDDTYQARVILPNILRAMAIIKGERVLDLACGQGFFTRAFFQEGADATGVDLGKQLVLIARKESPKEIKYFSHSAENLSLFEDSSFEKIAILLAIQNIEAPHKVFKECARVLKPHGKLSLFSIIQLSVSQKRVHGDMMKKQKRNIAVWTAICQNQKWRLK